MIDLEKIRRGDFQDNFKAVQDTCILCKRPFLTSNLTQVECDECNAKDESWKERVYKDNIAGSGERLGERSAIPVKIGGTWKGGGIENTANASITDNPWKNAEQVTKKRYGISSPWANRKKVLRNIPGWDKFVD